MTFLIGVLTCLPTFWLQQGIRLFERQGQGVISQFDQRIRSIYSPEDLKKGYIQTLSRNGERLDYPIMTISLAIISNEKRKIENHVQVAEIAAELKKKAKSLSGSNYVRDLRTS